MEKTVAISPTFASHLSKSVQSRKVTESVKHLFGRLRTVDIDRANKTREQLRKALKTLPECVKELFDQLYGRIDESEFSSTHKFFRFVDKIDNFIESKAHDWPAHEVFDGLYDFRENVLNIDKECNYAIRHNNVRAMLRWTSTNKELLPAVNEKYRINFALSPDLIEKVFPFVVRINVIAKIVLNHCIYPQYDWETVFERKSIAAYSRLPKRLRGTLMQTRKAWISQLPTLYLDEIGVTKGNVDWIELVDQIKQVHIDEKNKKDLVIGAKEVISQSMNNPTITNIFPKAVLKTAVNQLNNEIKDD